MNAPATALPTVFVSHGAPNLILHDSPARDFLAGFGKSLPRPRAILTVSAHFETARPAVVADDHPEMIYDFGGFERELYTLVYPAPGSREIAEGVAARLAEAGLGPEIVARRGYDHGVWVPLMLMFPDADIPVVQLSVQPGRSAAEHLALGRALASLREEGILVVGSGSFTHNLRAVFGPGGLAPVDAEVPAWVSEFADWMTGSILEGDEKKLLDWERAPYAHQNHPTDEHLMPLFVAIGAAGEGWASKQVHSSHQYGALMLDAFRFD
ncbi:MAG: class III extradiol ring-cleavage dioxygenase [Flavobacteriaceae bacterium]